MKPIRTYSISVTPTPWIAATRYSSIVGVLIVGQQGKRICNTAFAHHVDDDEAKRTAEANAAFIVKAVNNHDALVKMLEDARLQLEYVQEKHGYATGETVLARIRHVLASVGGACD